MEETGIDFNGTVVVCSLINVCKSLSIYWLHGSCGGSKGAG